MLFKYKYVNHEIEKFQKYSDFLFNHVWTKARGDFDSSKLNQYPELKTIYETLHYDDGDWAQFFNSSIENIYAEFLKLGKAQRKELKRWYRTNNKIHSLCVNTHKSPIKYSEIENRYPRLSVLLKAFYERLYGASSPFNLAVFGKLKELKKSHYQDFIEANFDGHEGICPFCGLNTIKGNDHSKLEAYDHFIPKGKYPFNSINFKNLAPMCHECNSSYKLEVNPLMNIDPLSKSISRRKAFYPYSKENWNVDIQVELRNPDLKTLSKEEIGITTTCNGRNDEIESWMEVFGIEERYRAKLLGKKAGINWYYKLKDGIHNARIKLKNENLTKEEWLDYLLGECEEDLIADCNFLKKPFYEECERINIA
ncbi:hypothetical protein [Algoriphagus halophytocola]|uniref:HNH endonuclease n=1 Tax=Algoriphagus halophytocola TaxID=2991499 RepID=A0ABY6MH18_9BACT|nr:hypothetical protein [Algoriphagus sp. TR-M5]UZD22300.1 hypothetical protein OM944_16765 [Algoriphagus sp. TR-M5]